MPEKSASSGSCTMVMPPRILIAISPIAPSVSVPDSTMPTTRAIGPRRTAEQDVDRWSEAVSARARGSPNLPVPDQQVQVRRRHVDATVLYGLLLLYLRGG